MIEEWSFHGRFWAGGADGDDHKPVEVKITRWGGSGTAKYEYKLLVNSDSHHCGTVKDSRQAQFSTLGEACESGRTAALDYLRERKRLPSNVKESWNPLAAFGDL